MKYRKRPVVIDAEPFDPGTQPWPEGVLRDERSPTGYSIGTLENVAQGHEVTPGDWIITGVQGEKYPCKPEVFAKTYESADTPSAPSAAEQALETLERLGIKRGDLLIDYFQSVPPKWEIASESVMARNTAISGT